MTTPTPDTPSSKPSVPVSGGPVKVNYKFFVTYLVLLSAFGSFVNDMFLPALPELTRAFRCSVPMAQMGLTTGMIGLAIGQLVLGPMSDRYGRKPVLLGSLALFVAAGIVSVFSPTIHFFLWCRLFQGLGASGGYFLARTLPADIFGGRMLARTMALIGAINGFAPASAPVLGGFISQDWGWRGIFIVLSAFALFLIVFSRRLKETLPPSRRVQGSLKVIMLNYRKLVLNRPFMIHTLLKGSALGLLFAYISAAPFIFQREFGYTELQFGLFMGLNALFAAAGSMVALRFKVLKNAALVGAIMLVVFVLAIAGVLWFSHRFWPFELLLLPIIFSMGMIFTVGNTLAMNEGRSDAGTASAILGVMGYIFGAVVAPLVGLGDIMHSTALVFIALSLTVLGFAILSTRLPADLDKGE